MPPSHCRVSLDGETGTCVAVSFLLQLLRARFRRKVTFPASLPGTQADQNQVLMERKYVVLGGCQVLAISCLIWTITVHLSVPLWFRVRSTCQFSHCFSAAVFHQQTGSNTTGLLSIPPVYFVVPVIFAVNVVSEIRNVSEMCSSAPEPKSRALALPCETCCATWAPLPALGVLPKLCPS